MFPLVVTDRINLDDDWRLSFPTAGNSGPHLNDISSISFQLRDPKRTMFEPLGVPLGVPIPKSFCPSFLVEGKKVTAIFRRDHFICCVPTPEGTWHLVFRGGAFEMTLSEVGLKKIGLRTRFWDLLRQRFPRNRDKIEIHEHNIFTAFALKDCLPEKLSADLRATLAPTLPAQTESQLSHFGDGLIADIREIDEKNVDLTNFGQTPDPCKGVGRTEAENYLAIAKSDALVRNSAACPDVGC